MEEKEAEKKTVHWAFLYALAFPGWGEYYAGSWKRARVTFAILTIGLVLFFWSFADFFSLLQSAFSVSLVTALMVKFLSGSLVMYFAWLWGMASAVDVAVENGELEESPSSLWPLFMTWLCPGAGHIYTRSRQWGYYLVIASFVAVVLYIPSGYTLFNEIPKAAGEMKEAMNGTGLAQVVSEKASLLSAIITYSLGAVLRLIIFCYAFAEVSEKVCGKFEKDGHSKGMSALYLLIAGYLCPGAGQILKGRKELGWYLVYGWIGFHVFMTLTLDLDILTAGLISALEALAGLFHLAAALEAAARPLLTGKKVADATVN